MTEIVEAPVFILRRITIKITIKNQTKDIAFCNQTQTQKQVGITPAITVDPAN